MVEKLFEKIDKNCSNIDKNLIQKAYDLAYEAHGDQKRESGEPYIIHPIEVACILAEIGMDTSTICAGILHDVVEDTHYTYDDILNLFGEEVADLVQGLTKLETIKYKSKEEQQADNVRKMLLAMAKDIRVILIKLADRLHNMRTLKYMPEHKQKEKAKETLDIYAPLAHRLGISKIKWELEDLSLRYLKSAEYYDLVDKISSKRVERESYICEIIEELSQNISKAGIEGNIQGRPKHFYSIYNKMNKKNKSLDQIFDLTAIRVLVNTVVDCYATLGIVHTMYKPMPGRFKDYIAMPKPNLYQSLHSTVIGPKGKPFEIQIRTYEMHNTAEYGIAAHWKYKKGTVDDNNNKLDTKLSWLSDILEWQGETSDAEEFIEAFKIDLFSDEIFVFTPKGRVISLPSNSTPIDFAYRIHTDVGHRCVGAKVNGRIVPIDFRLNTGEIVEIITSSMDKAPSIDWLSIVQSNHAKSKIKAWYNKSRREERINRGKEFLEKEAKKQGYHLGDIIEEEDIKILYKRYNVKVLEDLYASVGTGSLMPSTVILKIKEAYLSKNKKETITLEQVQDDLKYAASKNKDPNSNTRKDPEVVIKDIDNIMIRFARCCNPVPGDEIIGYITKGRGVSVHRKDCKNIQNLIKTEIDKILEVSWGNFNGGEFTTELQIKSEDRLGLISQIMDTLNQKKIHLCSISASSHIEGYALINAKITVSSVEELVNLKKVLKKIKGIIEVYRLKS